MDTGLYTSDRTSRSATAYHAIKQSLLAGTYAVGGRLAEEHLAREVGVSRTPVREALTRLHSEGLVDRHAEGGYTPTVPDLPSIAELYEVRTSLEHTAVQRLAVSCDTDALQALQQDWGGLAANEPPPADSSFVLADEDFHLRLAAASGNGALVDVLGGVNQRIRPVRMHDFLSAERIEATIAQHLAIVDAAIDRDISAATAALDAHLKESVEVVQRRAAEAIARMVWAAKSP